MREKTVKLKGNNSFFWHNLILLLLLLGSIFFSILDAHFRIIPWPQGYENIIGVSSQIITAIATLVASIIGIAISLQNEEFFGVKLTKLYSLRVRKHYPILKIIVVSIVLCVVNLVCYMCGLTFAAIGTLFVALFFLLKVVRTEIPIMAKDEDALLRILKDNLINCYLKKQEVSKDLKDAIRYLLYRKNLKELYSNFKDSKDESYNKYLLLKLLEFQHDLAFDLKNHYEAKDQRIIASSLLENVFDVIFQHIDMTDEQYAEIGKNRHLLTRILFRINELPATSDILLDRIEGLFQCLTFKSALHDKVNEFLSEILIALVAGTIKDGDFGILKGIRRQLSMSNYCLKQSTPALDVFAVISMHIFYLCNSEKDTPPTIKDALLEFIDEKGHIEENTRIVSWKNLFVIAASTFDVDYNNFIKLSLKNEHSLEYWLYGIGAKSVVLNQGYLTNWYLTHTINAHTKYVFNFSDFITKYPSIKDWLKNFCERCFDENGTFTPTEEMKSIIQFYSDKEARFSIFSSVENREHSLFTLINQLKLEDVRNDVELAMQIDEKVLASKIQNAVKDTLQAEWGYTSSIAIDSEERHFAVLLEKFPNAINFEESLIDYAERSVLYDMEQALPKTSIYNDISFEDSIRGILSKKLKFCTKDAKTTIPQWFIKDPELQQLYMNVCNPLTEFDSKLINHNALVVEQGFKFNFDIPTVIFRPLTEEELSKQVAKHQREDGQYVFNGAFIPQEEIAKMIRDKFTVLMITIRYKFVASKDTIFELHPYNNGPEEE